MATLTVRQSGGDYSSLSAALAAAGASDTISIEGTWTVDDTSAATVADDNLTIQTDADSKHPGYWDESQNHYRLVVSGSHALTLNGAFTCTVDGLAIEQAGTGTSDEAFRCVPGSADTVTIRDCILRCANNTSQQDCVYTGFNTTIGTITLENCILYGAARGGVHIQNFYSATRSGTVDVNSCTIWQCGRDGSPGNSGEVGGGIKWHHNTNDDTGGFVINCHNTVSVENDTGGSADGEAPADYKGVVAAGTTDVTFNVSFSIDSDNSISTETDGGTGNLASRTATDNTSPGTGDWVIFEDITNAPYDLRIVDNAENDAQDAHTTDTAHGLTIPATDIVGTSRPQNTNHDIGAFEIAAAGGASAITGTAAGAATVSADLTATGDLAGTSAGVATPTASLVGTGALSGASAGVATASADLNAAGALAGTSAGVATASADLNATGALAGTSAGVATSTAALTADGALAGTSAGVATVTGDLTDASAGAIAGTAAGAATVSGALTATGTLSATSAGTATATADLAATGDLAGTSAGVATLSGNLVDAGSDALTGTATGIATVTGALSATGDLAGTSAGVATVTGHATGVVDIAGTAAGSSTVAGDLAGTGTLSATAVGVGVASAELTATGYMVGTAAGVATVTATITGIGLIVGSVVELADAAAYVVELSDSAAYVVTLVDEVVYEIELEDVLV